MTERERNANQSLRALDEAHRTGRITREEYRSRRRYLLGALGDSHVVTARNAIVRPATPPPTGNHHERAIHVAHGDVVPGLFPPRYAFAWKPITALVTGALLCALLVYWLWHAG
jgi:hypothetical protein